MSDLVKGPMYDFVAKANEYRDWAETRIEELQAEVGHARGLIADMRVENEHLMVLASAPAAGPWRTMESAPKDGTWILACNPSGDWRRISWGHNRYGEPCWASVDYWWHESEGRFTHWCPLPPVPLTRARGGEVFRALTPPQAPVAKGAPSLTGQKEEQR